jgi:hypothetical protein
VLAREEPGAPPDRFVDAFIEALAAHRFFQRQVEMVVA